ncbi:MAG TPA: lysophospholipid acyltransferase family protein [Oligoflexus sp.]|uniref:lysophospholipid acyltransferase family protein n=1 Tax=Oligoflexus sp. TaxID=1971216 RepID=UPI002D6B26B1|nr:lysophospholipid acyltransferase family protein [Oligoflexus sp.]HYX38502.1 lysophospholipid acyltransferase family protein [Oligoflexus sp.]
MKKVALVLRCFIAALWMHGAAFLGLVIYVLTLGLGLEWIRSAYLPFCSRVFLGIFGLNVRVMGLLPKTEQPVVWICNHRSTLDIFVILSLGLPHTRYFLSDFLQRIPAFFIVGRLLKTFWTPAQTFPERRIQLFQRAADTLRLSRESVFLTPEGERIDSRLVGKFNKGAFHLAMDLRRPVAPIFVDTPDDISPGRSWRLRAGTVTVSFLELIEAPQFHADRLPVFIQEVRTVFLQRAMAQLG